MKAICLVGGLCVVVAVAVYQSSAALIDVKISGTSYNSADSGQELAETKLSDANFISDCTDTPGAKLVAEVDDIDVGPTVIMTVDPCGDVLCTNLIFTTLCNQNGATSNGSTETEVSAVHVSIVSPSGALVGGGFLSEKAVGSPVNSFDVISFSASGYAAFCNTNNGSVLSTTLSISGAFKKGKDCP
jgi:hypothetical protein